MEPKKKQQVGQIGKDLSTELFKIIDPTGISSWGDVRAAYNRLYDAPTIGNGVNLIMETAGAIPMVGKIAKTLKIAKNAPKYAEKIAKLAKQLSQEESTIDNAIVLRNAAKSAIQHTKKYIKPRNTIDKISAAARTSKFVKNSLDPDWRKDVAANYSENSGGIATLTPRTQGSVQGSDMRYTGLYRNDSQPEDAPFKNYPEQQNAVRLAMYGDDTGFEKANIAPIISNGDTVGNPSKYYYGTILPLSRDSMYVPNEYKQLFKPGKILRAEQPEDVINNTMGQYIVDAKKYSYGIRNGNLIAFDPWDNGWENGGILGSLWDYTTKPSKRYPNSGIPTFVQNIPIKYTSGNRNDPKFKDFDRFVLSLLQGENKQTDEFINRYDSINSQRYKSW